MLFMEHDMCAHVKAFIPVWIQRFPDDAGSLGLFAIDGSYREGVRKAWTMLDVARTFGRAQAYGTRLVCRVHRRQ